MTLVTCAVYVPLIVHCRTVADACRDELDRLITELSVQGAHRQSRTARGSDAPFFVLRQVKHMSYQQINDTWIYQDDTRCGPQLAGFVVFLWGLAYFWDSVCQIGTALTPVAPLLYFFLSGLTTLAGFEKVIPLVRQLSAYFHLIVIGDNNFKETLCLAHGDCPSNT